MEAVDGPQFKQFRVVLDNIMKERALQNIGMVKKQAQLIPLSFEQTMWDKGVLGEHEPEILRDTVLFLVGINCGLRAGDEHHDLRRMPQANPLNFLSKEVKMEIDVLYTQRIQSQRIMMVV